MSIYDFQSATADRIADIFRTATIDADGKEIKNGGHRRVLLADEVGLGKTHVASAVIERVREMRKAVNDDMFRVVYVCSNMSIANQNIEKLGVKNKADVTESRLSMQHLTIREREAEIVDSKSDKMGEIIIPLTPSTSFSLRGNSKGNANERALIATILDRFDEFSKFKPKLSELFKGRAKDNGWEYWQKHYSKRVNALGLSYINDVKCYLSKNQDFLDVEKELIENFNHGDVANLDSTRIINLLRRIFADLSLSMLEPDLIIMDEFQRFSSLLHYDDESEQSTIVKKFFEQEGGQQPLILLLSATPYKPFSTLEELTEYNADEHYEDFNRLMDFLFNGENEFHELWSDYSHKLSHLRTEKFDVLLASKQSAEEKMYQGMCRTERLNDGLIKEFPANENTKDDKLRQLGISENDILSYCEMQKVVAACKEAYEQTFKQRFPWFNVPMEYVKSSPYLLSFMDSYDLKQKIDAVYRRDGFKDLPKPSRNILLREMDIARFHKISMGNARMQYLRDMMLPKSKGAELLLWVPASRPYYTTNAENPFVKNRDFSKTLVFSAWEMVPRMIATLMTYEVEREVIFSKYKKAGYDKSTGGNRLKTDAQNILTYPSKFLASLYNPADHYGDKLHLIKATVRKQISEAIHGIPTSERRNYGKILRVIEWLDNPQLERPDEIPANTIDILCDMAIAAPGVCLYRILNSEDDTRETAKGFVTIFNRRLSGYIIDKLQDKYHEDEFFLEGVMDYCSMGNLQAVLDEFRHLCSTKEDFIDKMKKAFINVSTLRIDTDNSFGSGKGNKFPMRISYAVPFAKNKNTMDDKAEARSNNIRTAFQSPFYPFIVASTSVGQEGLDFHWYCRKIMHWNLPSNPQDLEQREGRINRYKCLAIRRNIAKIFPDIYDWDKLFDTANEEVKKQFEGRYSGMVPNWCLPAEWIHEHSDTIEWIERIVPQYPMSSDVDKYKRLIDVLSLYRLTMGQPRQEELLEMIELQHLTQPQIDKLLFNLSPIAK